MLWWIRFGNPRVLRVLNGERAWPSRWAASRLEQREIRESRLATPSDYAGCAE